MNYDAQFGNTVFNVHGREEAMKLLAVNLDRALNTIEDNKGWSLEDIAIVRAFDKDGWTWHVSFDKDEDAFADLGPQSLKDGAELLEMVKAERA